MTPKALPQLIMYSPKELIWITWENHRRTNELSKALGVTLFTLLRDGDNFTRTALLSAKTLALLLRLRPRRVIVQNPSMVLAGLVCCLKSALRYKVIVDRHSAFMVEMSSSRRLIYRALHCLSRYTLRRADLTIVTNNYLEEVVRKCGGRAFVLQDKLPGLRFGKSNPPQLMAIHNIVYICSFLRDEPVAEVLEAAGRLDKSTAIYITGNHRRFLDRVRVRIPKNVVFTGFLPERDFQSLLGASDAVMVLTKREHTLLCGAYEAVSLGKPLILSNTRSLHEYFGDGPVYTDNEGLEIARAIRSAIETKTVIALKIRSLRDKLEAAWTTTSRELSALIQAL